MSPNLLLTKAVSIYTLVAFAAFFIALSIGISIQRCKLYSMHHDPAAITRNPINMVATFIMQWKEIKRIRADMARQRAEEEHDIMLLQLRRDRRGGTDRVGEHDD